MQGANQDAYHPPILFSRTLQSGKEPTLEPDNVIILFCDSAFRDHTIGTLPRCSVENSSGGVQHAVKATNQCPRMATSSPLTSFANFDHR